MSKLLYFLVG